MKRTLTVLVILGLLSACSGKTEIKNAVIAYNRQLIEALSTANAGRLQYFATLNQMGRVDAYILYLKKDKKLLVSDLKDLEFLRIERKGDTARVWTKERWVYHYIDLKSRQRLTKDEEIHYRTLYVLKFQDGHWMVDQVKIEEEK